jgi:tetratricopeptide (TPR) repeat protein
VTIFPIVLLFAMQSASPTLVEHEQAGIAAQKQGQLDVAISEFQKATELNPDSATAFFDLGAAYMQAHRYGDAIKPLKKAVELKGEFPGLHESLGYALLSQGYTAEAIPQFQAANSREGPAILITLTCFTTSVALPGFFRSRSTTSCCLLTQTPREDIKVWLRTTPRCIKPSRRKRRTRKR